MDLKLSESVAMVIDGLLLQGLCLGEIGMF